MQFSAIDNLELERQKILEDAENSVEEIKKQQKIIKTTNAEKILSFSTEGYDIFSIKYNIIKEFNSANKTFNDLKTFCENKYPGDNGSRKAYNIIQGLDTDRDFRVDTIELICEFLNIDIGFEDRPGNNPNLTMDDCEKESIHINIPENAPTLSRYISEYINTHKVYYADLIAFCEKKTEANSMKNLRKAYNIIFHLKDATNIRASTIELLCEFLNLDLIILRK